MRADTVVIIGHDTHARGMVALLSKADAFETPLGPVEVDTDMVRALCSAHKGIILSDGAHRRDHTVEVHLPFLRTVLPKCRIVPVLFGEPSSANCRIFAAALAQAASGKKVFVLASTDFSHYPTDPEARKVDGETVALVAAMDIEALFEHLERARTTGAGKNIQTALCASGGVGTAMLFARTLGATSVRVLNTANSGAIPGGDKSRVVGYAAALFVKPAADAETAGAVGKASSEFTLPQAVQAELLKLARDRIRDTLAKRPTRYTPPPDLASVMDTSAPVFVTLHKQGRLRGCIGMTEARMEVWRAVYEMAFSAAFRDRRFRPVASAELDDIEIEISVLSPLTNVASAAEIIPGEHGVVVRRGGRSGLFLPQVWEQLPEKSRFLSILCSEKAGLPRDAWKDPGTELLTFTVFAFEEE